MDNAAAGTSNAAPDPASADSSDSCEAAKSCEPISGSDGVNDGHCPPEFVVVVVGVGASAGGLEALERMFRPMPADTGMAFVVVQHLSADFRSMMDELMGGWTAMPVHKVVNEMEVRADNIYLIPAGKEMIVIDGRLLLTDRNPERGLNLPIDRFLKSLAADLGVKAIAVILSGTGSDGSRGIQEVHAAGGLVLCQEEDTAKFDGMPRSARDTGMVDVFLAPEELAGAFVQYAEHPNAATLLEWSQQDQAADRGGLAEIFRLIKKSHDIDFSHYKIGTVSRRLSRRLAFGKHAELSDYVRHLRGDPEELDRLYFDLLIGVTEFFRDPEGFRALRVRVRELLADKDDGDEFRLWSAGCASGAEPYSLAMAVLEEVREVGKRLDVKVFATDVHRKALAQAAAGVYRREDLSGVPDGLRQRYFEPHEADSFKVRGELRQCVVFSPHNVVKDAPFTRLDVVSCRNMLIYLTPAAQRKAFLLFHFGLRVGGVLFIGPSETPGELVEEFETLDSRWKLYRKKRDVRLLADMRLSALRTADLAARPGLPTALRRPSGAVGHLTGFYDQLLSDFMPAALLVDQDRRLLHKFGGAGQLMQEGDGRHSDDVFDRLGTEMRVAAANGFQRALRSGQPLVYHGMPVTFNGVAGRRRVTFRPLAHPRDGSQAVLILFESEQDVAAPAAPADPAAPAAEGAEDAAGPAAAVPEDGSAHETVLALESELRHTKENVQAIVEELETSNEELQAANEELVAANEEMQSTNEELNSVNEELYSVNAEYHQKIAQLTEVTNDMENLFRSTETHTVFLDRELRIRKFTPQAAGMFQLLPHDVGRRFDSFHTPLDHPGMVGDLRRVLDRHESLEREIAGTDGAAYLMRILPYRADKAVEGVVLTLVDIGALKAAQTLFRTALEASGRAMVLADGDGRVVLASSATERLLGRGRDSLTGGLLTDLVAADDDEGRDLLRRMAAEGEPGAAVRRPGVRVVRADGATVGCEVTCVAHRNETGHFVLASFVDATDAERMRSMLFRREHLLRSIMQNLSAAVYVKDLDGRFQLVNPFCAELLGHSAEQLVGRRDADFVPAELAADYRRNDEEVVRTGKSLEIEEKVETESGVRTFLSIKFPVFDQEGQVVGTAGVSSDITVQKRQAADARHAVLQRDRFLAMLSHELRNPLASLDGGLRLLEQDGGDADREWVEGMMRRQTDQMLHLIDDLLDVTRIGRGKMQLERGTVDLRTVVGDSVESMAERCADRRVTIAVDLPATPAYVDGDPYRLRQVVVNLLTNAVRHSSRGQGIDLGVRSDEDAGEVVLTARDRGPGVAAEQRARVFDLFVQLDGGEDNRTQGGLGIGLSLVKRFTELHGGTVAVDDAESGPGSVFTVRLPGVAAPAKAEPPAAATAQRDGRNAPADSDGPAEATASVQSAGQVAPLPPCRILVADDNRDLALSMRHLLSGAGHEVRIEHDGDAAARTATAWLPDLVLLDIGMPGRTGHQVAEQLRGQSETADLPLLAVSGYGQPSDRQRSRAAGFDAHLTKPVTLTRLLECIGRVVQACGPSDADGRPVRRRGDGFVTDSDLPDGPAAKPAAGATPRRPDPAPRPQTPPAGAGDGQARVLVVEDQPAARRLLERFLERLDVQVRSAEDGASGLEVGLEFLPDMVLCDIGLPGAMDGFDVAREFRRHPELASARLAAVTGHGEDEFRQRARDSGFDDYLTKPVSMHQLQELVRQMARR